MTSVKEDLQAVAKALNALAKDLNKIERRLDKRETPPARVAKKSSAKQTLPAQKAGKKGAKAVVSAEPANASEDRSAGTVLEQVLDAVRRSRTGATIAKLKEKTGLDSRQLSNALYKLSKGGKIESMSRGVYIKKKA